MTNEITEKNKYSRKWIGRTFNDGKITVVDGGGKKGYCVVRCSVCAEDSELFGDGLFEARASRLVKSSFPCGCSKNTHWSLKQYEIIIKRFIIENNIPVEFLKVQVIEGKQLSCSDILLFHKTECKVYTAIMYCFLREECHSGKNFTKTYTSIENYNSQNKGIKIVWDTGCKKGRSNLLGYHCKTCEENGHEYIYEIMSSNLFAGQIPCVCAKRPVGKIQQYIQKDVEISIDKCDKSRETIKYVGYYKKDNHSIVELYCEKCRVGFERQFCSIEGVGAHCPRCHPPVSGYDPTKKGFFYILTVSKDGHANIGFGITNKLKSRLATHKKNLTAAGYSVVEYRAFSGYGTDVLSVEKYLKTIYRKQTVFCEGFVTESAPYDAMENIIGSCCKLTIN